MIRHRKQILFAVALLIMGSMTMVAASRIDGQTIQIPIHPPGPNRWIVDKTGQVPEDALVEINALCQELYDANNRELVVVVIQTTEGRDPNSFGTQLFNQWGVGSAFKHNGVMILAALDDRAAEIIIGQGEDYDNQVRMAEKIMDDIIVPAFKQGDIGSALYEGVRACATRILGVADLQSPRNLDLAKQMERLPPQKPQWSLFRQIAKWGPTPWYVGLGCLGIIGIFWFRHYNRYRQRDCLVCGGETTLLTEEQDDYVLDPPERLEEQLGSVDYDVWACLNCDDVVKVRYGKWFTRFSECPQCRYKTKSKITRTLVAATTSHGGRVRVDEDCRNCSYHNTYTYHTPKIPKSSKRKGSSSSSFGRSSSRSSGGGFRGFGGGGRFGGGRSAGRGASGRW